jgi:hypothetical protein
MEIRRHGRMGGSRLDPIPHIGHVTETTYKTA